MVRHIMVLFLVLNDVFVMENVLMATGTIFFGINNFSQSLLDNDYKKGWWWLKISLDFNISYFMHVCIGCNGLNQLNHMSVSY